jgi:hypothetical protein
VRRRMDLERDTNPNHPCAGETRAKRSRAVHDARQLSDEAGAAECEKLGLKTSYQTLQDAGTSSGETHVGLGRNGGECLVSRREASNESSVRVVCDDGE